MTGQSRLKGVNERVAVSRLITRSPPAGCLSPEDGNVKRIFEGNGEEGQSGIGIAIR